MYAAVQEESTPQCRGVRPSAGRYAPMHYRQRNKKHSQNIGTHTPGERGSGELRDTMVVVVVLD